MDSKRLKKQQKLEMKERETPEEKVARRIAKKQAKAEKNRKKMGWNKDSAGYTNASNPFGDEKLLVPFVWNKKLENDGLKHLTPQEKKRLTKKRQEENQVELEKVKLGRLEREKEKQERDEEMELVQREREVEHFKAWESQEDTFHLEQAKLRSRIRINDNRAKPIDLLAKYAICAEEGAEDLEMCEPYTYLNGLTMVDLENLLEDINVYISLEQDKNTDFWLDMTVITQDELQTLRKISLEEQNPRDTQREGINSSVKEDVVNMFKGKSYKDLLLLQKGLQQKLKGDADVGFWEAALSLQKAYIARARLRERHQVLLKQKLLKLKEEQLTEKDDDDLFAKPLSVPSSKGGDKPGPSSRYEETEAAGTSQQPDSAEPLTIEDLELSCIREYEEGGYSPRFIPQSEIPPDAVIINATEDNCTIEGKRQLYCKTGDTGAGQEDAFIRRAKEGMDREEASFAVEEKITNQVILWSDKYRPRKPRFFNRVHTGFEWNKYNQTHYDFENPPPKVVQGYKFNIFYPDLVNVTKTPQYSLEADAENRDFAILRFSAGAPYEDIAFKVVNRDWEYSHKHGFRCQFINSIFQLWFHFKRYRYRR